MRKNKLIWLGLLFFGNISIAAFEGLEQSIHFSRICVLDNTGCAPKIYSFYPERSLCVEIKCFPSLESLTPAEEISFNLLARTHRRKTFSSHKFSANQKASGRNLLIDEYSVEMPFLWKLKCPHELKQVIKHFKHRILTANIFPSRPVPLLISLDYGGENTANLCQKNHLDIDAEDEDQRITEAEAIFLRKYFHILSSSEAPILFALYHKMLTQIENMKLSIQQWHSPESFLPKVGLFIKNCFQGLGLGEVAYRLFLLQMVLVFGKVSGSQIGKNFKNWVLRGAKRGCPSSCSSNGKDALSSISSASFPAQMQLPAAAAGLRPTAAQLSLHSSSESLEAPVVPPTRALGKSIGTRASQSLPTGRSMIPSSRSEPTINFGKELKPKKKKRKRR